MIPNILLALLLVPQNGNVDLRTAQDRLFKKFRQDGSDAKEGPKDIGAATARAMK